MLCNALQHTHQYTYTKSMRYYLIEALWPYGVTSVKSSVFLVKESKGREREKGRAGERGKEEGAWRANEESPYCEFVR